jgi:hypothetical protein
MSTQGVVGSVTSGSSTAATDGSADSFQPWYGARVSDHTRSKTRIANRSRTGGKRKARRSRKVRKVRRSRKVRKSRGRKARRSRSRK